MRKIVPVVILVVSALWVLAGSVAVADEGGGDDGGSGGACVERCVILEESCEMSCPPESWECLAMCQDDYDGCVVQC